MSYQIPSRIPSYLRHLASPYARTNPPLQKIIVASHVLVLEATAHDNWTGGMDGHDVRLYIPVEILGGIDADKQQETTTVLYSDLQKLAQGSAPGYCPLAPAVAGRLPRRAAAAT